MKRKIRKKPSKNRTLFWVIFLLLLIAAFAGWRIYYCLYRISPQFQSLTILRDGQPLKIINGETVTLHPENQIKIQEISTNVCFNYGVRLFAKEIDLNAFLFEELPISNLLPNKLSENRFYIEIKRFNETLGHIELFVEPYIEDWIDKADRTINPKRKVELLEQALNLSPEDSRIKERLLKEYKENRLWDKLASLLEKQVKDTATQGMLYDLLEAYEALSRTDKVIVTLKRILLLNPDDTEIRYRLASLYEEKGMLNNAILEYENILKNVSGKSALPIYETLGFLYSKSGKPKQAISAYLKAIELDKNDVNLYYNLSHLYEEIGQKDRSDYFLGKAIELKSGDIEGRLKLAESLIKKKKISEAEKHLDEVLATNPKSIQALLLMVKIFEQRQDKKGLIQYYQKILDLDQQNKTIIFNLGVLEYEIGNTEKALSRFETLKKSNPEDKEVRVFLFDIYRKLNKDDLAYGEALDLINLGTKDRNYYNFIFEYLNARAEYEKMIDVMKRGIKTLPHDTDLRDYLLLAYLETGKEDQAIDLLKEALKNDPDNLPLLLRLAKLQEKQQLFGDALESYKKIIEISPGHTEAEEAYLRLRFKVLPDETD